MKKAISGNKSSEQKKKSAIIIYAHRRIGWQHDIFSSRLSEK
jgi:hypothetical protein